MPEELFTITDAETGERFGPFNRRATYDRAIARHIETGNVVTVSRVGQEDHDSCACVMDGRFLTEIEHDEEGRSIGAKPWFPDDECEES